MSNQSIIVQRSKKSHFEQAWGFFVLPTVYGRTSKNIGLIID